ncbi:MAG TPA: M48 family metallopeptidase [Thermoanaerobaculaceae bacterium]|nr:M48 family metallopeptidase [Thermoanaerobaculaceae bacterium]
MRERRFGLVWVWSVFAVVAVIASAAPCLAQPAPAAPAATTGASAGFDPVAATEAYLAKVPAEQRARSDAYFEGGYWLILWDFLLGAAVGLALLFTRLSARMRDLAARVTRLTWLQTALYWVQYLVITALVSAPLSVYEGYFRDRKYGLATQTLGPWLGDQLKGLAIGALFGGLLIVLVYLVIRRAPRTWWMWGAGVAIVFLLIGQIIAPVFIAPLFNHYTKLEDPAIREPILRLARANGIPATDVWVFDASRQTTRVSANVSGLGGTSRISLNDNLLKRCSLAEIEATMGHEMGHYVLNHGSKGMIELGVLAVIGFALMRWGFDKLHRRWGARWGISGIGDVAGLPVLALLLSAYSFVLTPVTNTIVRTAEAEADIFGLNAARQPDGEAEVDLKLGEYRKLKPTPLEEFIFFDHPSGYNRILMAMRWKAENLH